MFLVIASILDMFQGSINITIGCHDLDAILDMSRTLANCGHMTFQLECHQDITNIPRELPCALSSGVPLLSACALLLQSCTVLADHTFRPLFAKGLDEHHERNKRTHTEGKLRPENSVVHVSLAYAFPFLCARLRIHALWWQSIHFSQDGNPEEGHGLSV